MKSKKKTLQVACALLVDKGKVLLAQRDESRFNAGLWEFPGGKLENGETAQQAITREIEEELNLSEIEYHYYCTVFHEYPTFYLKMDAFIANVDPKEVILKEHTAARWMLFKDVWRLPLAPADVSVAQVILESVISR